MTHSSVNRRHGRQKEETIVETTMDSSEDEDINLDANAEVPPLDHIATVGGRGVCGGGCGWGFAWVLRMRIMP